MALVEMLYMCSVNGFDTTHTTHIQHLMCVCSVNGFGVVQWLVDASSVAASGCHRWLALLGERVSKMCKSHLAST